MKRDRDNPEYVNEVWRRWQRRRYLPFRQADAAWTELWAPIVKAIESVLIWLTAKLDRLSR